MFARLIEQTAIISFFPGMLLGAFLMYINWNPSQIAKGQYHNFLPTLVSILSLLQELLLCLQMYMKAVPAIIYYCILFSPPSDHPVIRRDVQILTETLYHAHDRMQQTENQAGI